MHAHAIKAWNNKINFVSYTTDKPDNQGLEEILSSTSTQYIIGLRLPDRQSQEIADMVLGAATIVNENIGIYLRGSVTHR